MNFASRSLGKKSSSTARVVDGKLILSFPEALTPIVWQMDLTQAKASSLEVREDKPKNQYILTLRTAKSETLDIAPFTLKSEAVDALMAAAKALENAHGQIRPVNVISSDGSGMAQALPPRKKKRGAIILSILLIIVLFGLWNVMTFTPPSATPPDATKTQQGFGGPTEENGVPLSADEFLMKKRQ